MKNLFFVLILFATLLAFSEGANSYESICYRQVIIQPAQEPAFAGPRCRIEKDVLYIDGQISNEITYEIKYNPQIKHIELNSYGGLVEAGYEIAELVRQRGITTNVRKGAKCASACTLIFQSGIKRTAYPTVRFLYHGVRLGGGWLNSWQYIRETKGRQAGNDFIAKQMSEVHEETEKLFVLYVKYGMSPEFIESYKAMAIASDWFEEGNFTRTQNFIVGTPLLFKNNIVQGFDLRETIE